MKSLFPLTIAILSLAIAVLTPAYAAAPAKLSDIADASDISAEAERKIALLGEFTKNKAEYERVAKIGDVKQAAGVLAVMAQSLVEHDKLGDIKVAAADLRDAALEIRKSKDFDSAKAGLEKATSAWEGKAAGASKEADWTKLTGMHGMMEEANARLSKLRRTASNMRRGRKVDLDEAMGHAVTLAVLGLPMHVDTHEVKKDEQIKEWQEYSMMYRTATTDLVKAIRANDGKAAYSAWTATGKSCSKCHEVFRE